MGLFILLPCSSPFGSHCGQNLHRLKTTASFENLESEQELVLGEASGILPVYFWWLPFDLGTRLHYFLCNSATVNSIIKQAEEMRQCSRTGHLSKISDTSDELGNGLFGLPLPMFRSLRGLLG